MLDICARVCPVSHPANDLPSSCVDFHFDDESYSKASLEINVAFMKPSNTENFYHYK